MLEIKGATQGDINIIKRFLKNNHVDIENIEDYISNCMIAYDEKMVVATAGYVQVEDMAIIKFVVVLKNRRLEYLGDGIVKALLNVADRNGIKRVFVNTGKEEVFLKKVGFKEVSMNEVQVCLESTDIQELLNGNKVAQVILPDYFLKACKSHKKD